jgi:hypothetical protein
MECLRALWGDPDFAEHLIFEPERHYADENETTRMYHEMHTGKWWWKTQVSDWQDSFIHDSYSHFILLIQKKVERESGRKNCTVIPVIISSDQTQLTQFRNKNAYPVYLTIGNLPKHIRRKPSRQGQVLLGYLPTSKLPHIKNQASRRRARANLFHACMRHILAPLEQAGQDGVIMVSGDGLTRLCFPILAVYVGDYPEQVLVTLVKTGKCAVCDVPRNRIGDLRSTGRARDIRPIHAALNQIARGPAKFARACLAAGIKPIQKPFWKDLPFVNIYDSITPDILHQMYQGVLKHVINWIRSACGDAEIDARCRRLPASHHIRLFMKGITSLTRVTGTEHDQICRFLLALILDLRLPDGISNTRLIRAVRALLDFVYLARYPVQTSETLDNLDTALEAFHANKSIFVDLGIREDFNIPKLHFMGHYRHFFERYGSGDNFNTEYTERLHIDMAKHAYSASNRKDEYPQMTAWLDRREKIMQHAKYIRRRIAASNPSHVSIKLPITSLIPRRSLKMSKHPTLKAVSVNDIQEKYGAIHFLGALARFIIQYQHPDYTKNQIETAASSFHLPITKVSVFHRIKYVSHDVYSMDPLAEQVVDSIHVEPGQYDRYGNLIPGRFDTAIINFNNGGEVGVQGKPSILYARFIDAHWSLYQDTVWVAFDVFSHSRQRQLSGWDGNVTNSLMNTSHMLNGLFRFPVRVSIQTANFTVLALWRYEASARPVSFLSP